MGRHEKGPPKPSTYLQPTTHRNIKTLIFFLSSHFLLSPPQQPPLPTPAPDAAAPSPDGRSPPQLLPSPPLRRPPPPTSLLLLPTAEAARSSCPDAVAQAAAPDAVAQAATPDAVAQAAAVRSPPSAPSRRAWSLVCSPPSSAQHDSASRAARHGTARRRRRRAVPVPQPRHDGTTRHGTAASRANHARAMPCRAGTVGHLYNPPTRTLQPSCADPLPAPLVSPPRGGMGLGGRRRLRQVRPPPSPGSVEPAPASGSDPLLVAPWQDKGGAAARRRGRRGRHAG
jgi:hypothetical protein